MAREFKVQPSYEVWLGSQTGERYKVLKEITFLQAALTLNGSSAAIVTFSGVVNNREFDYGLIEEDGWLEIWRGSNESPKALLGDSPFLIAKDEPQIVGGGERLITLTTYSTPVIFEWPVVAYDSGTAYTAKTDYGDDMIKAIARENVGSLATDTTRDMSGLLDIQADTSAAPSLSKAFSRRYLGSVFTEICNASAAEGTRLYWDVVLKNAANLTGRKLELQTFTGQRGANRGLSSDDPFIFSTKKGNLEDVKLLRDRSGAVNYAYGLGLGRESSRNVQPASDSARIAASPWGRIKEGTRQSQASSDEGVLSEARSLLRERRPRLILTAKIKNTPNSQFGVHYGHGDLVVVEEFGRRYEAIVSPVSIYYQGHETIDARLRVEE